MVANLEDRGINLQGFKACPSLNDQQQRMQQCINKKNTKSIVEAIPMTDVYNYRLDKTEKSRIEKLEMFDEFEEW